MHAQAPDCPCPVCSAKEAGVPVSEICPRGECLLKDVPHGVRTHVRELRGCRQTRSRLYSLGFTPGTEITVYGQGDAGCRVRVRDTCVVLDCDSADSILCDDVGRSEPVSALCGHGPVRGFFGGHGRKGARHG